MAREYRPSTGHGISSIIFFFQYSELSEMAREYRPGTEYLQYVLSQPRKLRDRSESANHSASRGRRSMPEDEINGEFGIDGIASGIFPIARNHHINSGNDRK